jgi:lysophospholipase L1-like esterase
VRKLVADFSGKTRFVLAVIQDFSRLQPQVAAASKKLAGDLGIEFLDGGPPYNGAGPAGFVVRGDGHPNAKGHAVSARALADLFYAKGIVQKPGG